MCVFFFKQKTAYEMRISDWSSDVCSSDLDIYVVPAAEDSGVAIGAAFLGWWELGGKALGTRLNVDRPGRASSPKIVDAAIVALPDVQDEIGRASWRERVCQYV